jgi:drug/metabolite transporter (DMT)-like permease
MSAPAHNPILVTALRWGVIFAAALAIVAGGVGLLVGGTPGLWGGLLGSVLAFAFLALTAGSMLLGRRLTTDDPNSPLFYGVVLAVWLVKLIVFFLFMYWLRDQPWLDAWVFFFTVIAAVLGSLIVDGFAFVRARTPYVDVALPGDEGEHS